MRLRTRIHQILEPAVPGDRVSLVFDWSLIALIVLNVVALIIETIPGYFQRHGSAFRAFEFFSVAVFSVEYVLRVWSCKESSRFASIGGRLRFMVTPLAVVDLLAVLPTYLPMLGIDLRVLRSVRLFRLFRIAKIGRYSESVRMIGRVVRNRREELVVSLIVLLLLLTVASSLLYFAERDAQPEVFSSIPAAMWWGVETLTTVGYGDALPVTLSGKLLGSVFAILGIGMFALPTGILGAGFLEEVQARKAGSESCPHCGKRLR